MKWLSAHYQPTTLFSLKPSWATSSGGKSLLLPTPYALKMALLDVAIRVDGVTSAERDWAWLRRMPIGIQLPQQMVVTNLFAKILKLRRRPATEDSSDMGPFQKTIGYREYVFHSTPISFVFGVEANHLERLSVWLLNLNYLGKRGGFVQLMGMPTEIRDSAEFVMLTETPERFPINGLIQQVDDCDPKMKFDQANIYTSNRPKRIVRQIVLPYRLAKSSRSYSLYEHV
ncbi:MAG: hypothetical protein M9930_07470 [Anaerolineae bacterium]|nr:hypothetical protein [Anaerolineae bacterium]